MGRAKNEFPSEIRRLIPLTPAVLFILLALADGEKHGYAIMLEVKVLSEKKVHMGPGTLYTTLQRLLELGLIDESAPRPKEDARRRYYRLSRTGKALLETEMSRLEALVLVTQKKRLALRHAN